MIYVVLCKVSQPSREEPKSYDGKFVTAKCSSINYGATLSRLSFNTKQFKGVLPLLPSGIIELLK